LLGQPVPIYSEQLQLEEKLVGTVGLIGARNTLFASIFRLKVEPVTGSGSSLPPLFETLNNNTQTGGSLSWSHSLTPTLTLTGIVDGSRTVFNTQPGSTKQGSVRADLSTPIAPLTTVYGGVRYQIQRSTITNDYDEAAIYVGINHRFH
jgi:uncharacterized protein (PEP-CTERM system associated)